MKLSHNLYMAEAEGVLPPLGMRKITIDKIVDELVTFYRGGANIELPEIQEAAFSAHNVSIQEMTAAEINYLIKQVTDRIGG